MEKHFLVNVEYDNKRSRIMVYFAKNLEELNKYDYVYSEKYYPSMIIKLNKVIVKNLLSEFAKEIIITEKKEITKITTKNFEVLEKCKKLLQLTTNQNLLLIEPERQFLIDSDWSYYDTFYRINKNKINRISESPLKNINFILKKMINELDLKIEARIKRITQKIIFTNYLKKKIKDEITTTQAINYLFENYFYKKEIPLSQEASIQYNIIDKKDNNYIKIDFTKTWAHLLVKDKNNIGYETLNCDCCKPSNPSEENILFNSLIEVEFLKNGFYFLSKDYMWTKEFHLLNENKDKRERYKKQNNLTSMPIGPFNKGENRQIQLIDAIRLYKDQEIKILENHNYKWFCKKERSFISEAIEKIITIKNNIDKSIELTTKLNYSNNSLVQVKELERNNLFCLYLSEQKIHNELLSEVILFIQNKNTLFYSKEIDYAIKSLKQKTYEDISKEEHRFIVKQESINTKEKGLLQKINCYFPKINIPIPEVFL